ncbi:MAG TPA: BamA/TamA family outer membrane protein [Bacteroidia bacterium]
MQVKACQDTLRNTINDTLKNTIKDTVKFKKPFTKKLVDFVAQKRKFLITPMAGRGPSTGFLAGIYYLKLFRIKGDTATRTSYIETWGVITERLQFYQTLNNTILFDNEKYFLRGNLYISKYNEFFYGIGNNINVSDKNRIDFNYINALQRLTRNIKNRINIGLQGQYNETFNLKPEPGSILDVSNAYGKNGSRNVGFGPVFLYDSRDHVIYTRTGTYLDVSAMFFQKQFGTQYPHQNLLIDFRKFVLFYKKYVMCFQTLINYNWGNVPFRQLALMGGDVMMRGYYPGIYRDNFLMATQLELRLPIYKFVGIVLFGGIGEVQHTLPAFNVKDLKYTYGFGLRLMLIKHERVNVGGDLGFSKNTKTLGLGSGESF